MDNNDTGLLLNKKDIALHRSWFKSMVKLLGIIVQYQAPRENFTKYNTYGELNAHYYEPISVGVIYEDHPTQQTMKKLGWNAELAEGNVIIHVPYDLEKIQVGALFTLPAGLDDAEPRMFRVIKMTNIAVYPASIVCELAPIYNNELPKNASTDFTMSNFNLLDDESEQYGH